MGGLSVSSSITSRDRSLMAALDNPAALIDPFEFGEWAKRPEIQQALNARQQIREIREQDALAADRRIAIDTLKAVIAANKDLKDDAQRLESRRAASAILRIIGAATRQASGSSSPSFPFTRLRPRVRPAPDIPPERIVALAAEALANPTDESLADLTPFLTPAGSGAQPDTLGVVMDHDLDLSPATAVQYAVTGRFDDHLLYTLTLARRDRPPTRLTISITRREHAPRRGCWLIYSISSIANTAPAPRNAGPHQNNSS